MSVFARSASILWVLMLSLAKSTVGKIEHIRVTNSLAGNLDLTLYCSIDRPQHILHPRTYYEWDYDTVNGKKPFTLTAHIKVTNSLAANLDLTVYCKTDRRSHVLDHGTNYEFDNDNSQPKPFTCFFLWDGAHHMFHFYNRCDWFVKQSEPCRNKGTAPICFNWKS
ncbi:hypothetical protein VNO77_20952 [Canavalia gladiata]|uniref:S-protein homolog n=1 Tax=Canavalia gladiata TaxID=3824 RepID=A0AAN9LV91_CANGL